MNTNEIIFVYNRCEDEESCNVSASIFVFGEPCIFTSKYLQVNYTCVDAPPPPPPPNSGKCSVLKLTIKITLYQKSNLVDMKMLYLYIL